jgi:hypothetical protein
MTNNKPMKYITDRACYNVLANFKCAVIVDPSSFNVKTVKKILKKEIENAINIRSRFGILIPYVKFNTFNIDIFETVEEQPDNILTVYSECNTELCFEDCENFPFASSANIIIGLFMGIGGDKDFIKSASAFDICIDNPIKGYIQADNTLYFPNKL